MWRQSQVHVAGMRILSFSGIILETPTAFKNVILICNMLSPATERNDIFTDNIQTTMMMMPFCHGTRHYGTQVPLLRATR